MILEMESLSNIKDDILKGKNLSVSIGQLKEHLEPSAELVECYHLIGERYFQQNNFKEARKCWNNSIEFDKYFNKFYADNVLKLVDLYYKKKI
jgi:tetratricopeptide (TPR) repeat protein